MKTTKEVKGIIPQKKLRSRNNLRLNRSGMTLRDVAQIENYVDVPDVRAWQCRR